MTADELVAAVQSYTDADPATLTFPVTLECVNSAVRRMTRKHDWRPLQVSVDLPVSSQTGTALLPPDFLRDIYVYTKDSTQPDPSRALIPIARLVKPQWFQGMDPINNLDPVFPSVASPQTRGVVTDFRSYYTWGYTLTIVPTPSFALTVQLDYTRTLPDLVLNLTPGDQHVLAMRYPDVIRWGALREAYDFLHEDERAMAAEARFQMLLTDAIANDNAPAFGGPSPKRGT